MEPMDFRNASLAAGTTLLAMIGGIWVAAYLTVPNPQLVTEGGGFVVFDPEIGMVPRPSAHTRRIDGPTDRRPSLIYDIYTDDRGARVDGPGQHRPDRVDLMTIGCSFTWGHPIDNADTYAARLRRELGVSVSNFAMVGYGTTQSLQMLRRHRDLAPKLVIYGFITAHLDRNVTACAPSYHPFCLDVSHVAWDETGRPRVEPPFSNGVRRFQEHLDRDYLNPAIWLTHGVDVIFGRLEQTWYYDRIPDNTRREQAQAFLLREMERTVADMGSELLVVYIPTNFEPPPPELARVIGKTRLLDLTPSFERHRAAGGPPLYVVDDGHPTPAAHAIIADEIARYIKRERLL
jgi:hypothetical protein